VHEKAIEARMRNLPEDLRREVLDYVEFPLSKYQSRKTTQKRFKFDWEGGLADVKEKFSSVELQHKALEWR